MKEKKRRILRVIKIIKKRLKLRTLILLILTFAANSYAWFVYATKVSNSVEAHVRSWNVKFNFGSTQLTEYVNFNIDNMYPGMDEYANFINIVNSGETVGRINYEIVSARILDTTYNVPEDITSSELINSFLNDYPFIIDIGSTNELVSPNGGEEQFSIKVNWEYESNRDDLDTKWGNRAYDYYKQHPDSSIISIRIKINVIQA
ncbi:MAG: hypothetical protein MRZ37_00435 [Tenericutes bacterium]|nr:hypothetical protein [Mycoplasmatota bacterium]